MPSHQNPIEQRGNDAGMSKPPMAATPTGPSDVNVHFDQTTGKWQYEDPNTGAEFEYDDALQKWKRLVDEDEWKQQQDAYKVAGVDEERPASAVERRMGKKKRKELEGAADPNSIRPGATSNSLPFNESGFRAEQQLQSREASAVASAAGKRSQTMARPRINSSIFLSHLPLDADAQEIASVFSRFGIISEDDQGSPRIKLYSDAATGMFKGEALLTYFKPESCELAIQLLDGTCLRAAAGQSKPEMKVEMADWTRSDREQPSTTGGSDKTQGLGTQASTVPVAGPSSGEPPAGKRPRTEADKKKAAKRFARMNDKLTGWESDSDDETAASLRSSGIRSGYANPTSRVVVLKRMFTLAELEEDPTLLLDLKADVRDECDDTIGPVTNVTLWDEEPEGLVTVKFKRPEDAQECVKRMDGRFFAQRRVEAFLAQGNKVRFRRSGRGGGAEDDEDDGEDDTAASGTLSDGRKGVHNDQGTPRDADKAAEDDRQDAFGAWLERGGD
ncbi:unnamed protein product [Parajaminaea phylloscopi]